MRNKFLGLFGLAVKAGKVKCGAFACEDAIRKNKAELVIIAGDCAENSRNNIIRLCEKFNTEYAVTETKQSLALMTGKSETAFAAVTDSNFKNGLLNLINGGA